MTQKYDPTKLFLETYNVWFENEESFDAARKSDKKRICTVVKMTSF